MRKTTLTIALLLMLSFSAHADFIVLDYPSEDAVKSGVCNGPLGAGGGGVCFNAGDTLTETFLDTGLGSAVTSRWQFSMSDFTAAGVNNDFDVFINGIVIGSFGCLGVGAGQTILDFDITFDHAAIAGDDYTLQIVATTTVPPGLSSWNWIAGGSVTLSDVVAVPEPGTLALLGIGLAGMGLARRRRIA